MVSGIGENSNSQKYYLGLDIGSVSLNTVILDDKFTVIEEHYDYVSWEAL